MSGRSADVVPGLAGAIAWMLVSDGELTQVGVGVVAVVSATFGMLSSASRARTARDRAWFNLVLNAGAIWITAFCAASLTTATPALVAIIGLGVGLAGTRALEVIENGAMVVLARVSGQDEAERRQEAQRLIAAAHIAQVDREGREKTEEDDDAQTDL